MRENYLPMNLRTFLIILLFALAAMNGHAAELQVQNLRCEYRSLPLGIEVRQPRLSWQLASRIRGQRQTAYRILVASTSERLARNHGDLWDSEKVSSSASLHIVYGGRSLLTGQRAYWKVCAWDAHNRLSEFSDLAWWEMGLLNTKDWRADWITRRPDSPKSEAGQFEDAPAPLLRKEFTLAKKIRRARAYISGLGYYELRLNGKRVGDSVLDPGWTEYSRRVLYSTYDVTALLRQGANCAGALVGNGWYNPLPLRLWGHLNLREHLTIGQPRLRCQMVIEFVDGSTQSIGTDASWKVSDSPIRRNNVYLGEVYDARQEQDGWDQAGYDETRWQSAALAPEPIGLLHAQDAPPIRVTRTLKPVRMTEPKPGVFIFDFGQNFAGWTRLRVQGSAGTRVRMRFGELLYPDGTLNGMTSVCGQIKQGGTAYRYEGVGAPRTAFQQDEYILRGGGMETYTPRFTYHGFRYVEVTGFPGKPSLHALEGLRLNSDVMPVGSFECSNPLFNRIQQMVLWTQLSNLFSVQSDCPHREKFGYGGDIVATSEMAMLNFDMSRFYAKAVSDLRDAVRPNGGFTETAPFVGIADEGLGEGSGPIGWGTASPLLVWQLYQYYGDRRILEENYDAVKSWVALLQSRAKDGILDNGISDHESLVPKPRALTGTGFYFLNVTLFERIARILGHDTEARQAAEQGKQIREAFRLRFLQAGTGRFDMGTQASQAFALKLGLVPPEEQERALETLVRDIQETHKGHLSTGIFGTKFLLHVLADLGRADVAYSIVNQRAFPGWGYMLERGATTLWEHWEFSDNTFSHNHPMFGSVSEWFYKVLGGIQPTPDAAGFDRILIRPHLVGDLKWVKVSYESVRGRISSEWRKENNKFLLRVRIPIGATALVYVPSRDKATVMERKSVAEHAEGVTWLRMEAGCAVFAVAAGEYTFQAPVNR